MNFLHGDEILGKSLGKIYDQCKNYMTKNL